MSVALQTQSKATASASFSSAPKGLLQRKCVCGGSAGLDGECEECRNKHLQRRAANGVGVSTVPPIVHDVLRSPGQPLDPATRTFMEPRFGHDFSKVRIHTDAKAVESARAVNAAAYTVGSEVVFGAGQYAPRTAEGKMLLAHELAHVVQQTTGSARDNVYPENLSISDLSDSFEQAADLVADGVVRGLHNSMSQSMSASLPLLQRHPGNGGGGPYHPPEGVKSSCTALDNCSTLSTKINYLQHTIKRHIEWDIANPDPKYPGGRHAPEIKTLTNALNNCKALHNQKCTKQPEVRPVPSFKRVLEVLAILGLSLLLAVTVIAALVDPEPATKLALAGLSAAQISLLLTMLGRKPPNETPTEA